MDAEYGPSVVTVQDGIQKWTILQTGWYEIIAGGASASPPACVSWYTQEFNDRFGKGAVIQGTFWIEAGTQIQVLVGQSSVQSEFNGGGGGTFVALGEWYFTSTPLLVAGGGGSYRCGFDFPNYQNILDASAGTNGVDSSTPGGSNGSGGVPMQCGDCGTPGAGFYGNGGPSSGAWTEASAFVNGGIGGECICGYGAQSGGFGGGGAGGWGGSGGGGGYSGGGSPNNNSFPPAGGGGSFNSGINQINVGGVNVGHGFVQITLVASE